MDRVEVVVLVEHGVEVDLIDLADGADVARADGLDLDLVLALPLEDMADADGLLLVVDDEF